MAYPDVNQGLIGRGKYWAYFFGLNILTILLAVFAVDRLIAADFALALLLLLLLVPVNIYWRVIMMRRCRDIGWPTFLPWAFLIVEIIAETITSASLSSMSRGEAMRAAEAWGPTDFIYLADLLVMIVIGCIRSRDLMPNYRALFGDEGPQPARPARPTLQRPVPSGYQGDAYNTGEPERSGFGRKVV